MTWGEAEAWRAILSTVPRSSSLDSLSDFAERLYWRMLSQSDSWGRLPGDVEKIRKLCVPGLARTEATVAKALSELGAAGRLLIYDVGGRAYCQLLDFDANQSPELIRKRGRSKYPSPPDYAGAGRRTPRIKTETETEEEKGSYDLPPLDTPGAAADFNSPQNGKDAVSHSRNGGAVTWETAHTQLKGADERTASVIASIRRQYRLPEAALHKAMESLRERRAKSGTPLTNEAKYLVSTLKGIGKERDYS